MKIAYKNLRKNADGLLQPVGTIKTHSSLAGWTPAGRLAGNIIAYKDSHIRTAASASPLDLGAEILCANPISDTQTIVMTKEGPQKITLDNGNLISEPLAPTYPTVVLSASAASPITVQVNERPLSQAYTAGPFKASEEKTVCSDLASAYRRLCRLAAAAGVAVQPALARYRLIGSDGNILFQSAPLLLMAPTGAQCAESKDLFSDDGRIIKAYSLRAETWKIKLDIPAAADMAERVSRLDVMLTPLFHPFDSSKDAQIEYGRRTNAADVFARVALPGREQGLSDIFCDNASEILCKAMARIDSLEKRLISINAPFGNAAKSMILNVCADANPDKDSRRISSCLEKAVNPSRFEEVMLNSPHTFSAKRLAIGGNAAVWSGITALPFKGYAASMFAAGERTDASWSAVAAVKFNDGRGVIVSEEGSAGAFTSLSPVLSYPSPDAVEMIVTVHSGSTTRSMAFPLTPDASGRNSVYVYKSMKPIELPIVSATQIVDFAQAPIPMPGIVAFAGTDAPTIIRNTTDLGEDPWSILPFVNSGTSWEFGRSRFIAALPSRIISIGVNGNFTTVSKHLVCLASTGSPQAITTDGEGGFYVVFSADPGIHHIGKSGSIVPFVISGIYRTLLWNSATKELWAKREDGKIVVFAKDGHAYFRSQVSDGDFIQTASDAFIAGGYGITDIGDETAAQSMEIEAEDIIIPQNFRPVRINKLHIDMQASAIEATIDISASSVGKMREWLVRKAVFSGTCAGPLRIPLISRRVRALHVALTATVSPDFRLRPLNLQ